MRVSVVATGIEAEEILYSSNDLSAKTSVLLAEEIEIEKESDKNLSLEEPIVAKTQEIFDEVDNEILADEIADQSRISDNHGQATNSETAEGLHLRSEPSPGTPSRETLARLRAAITKEPADITSSKDVDESSETDRPKFGISSLISRMSRSEAVSSGPVNGNRKEPNLNSDFAEKREIDDLEQEKIEVPAFLRRQAN